MPEPLLAKLLFKLHPDPYLLTKLPATAYAFQFVDVDRTDRRRSRDHWHVDHRLARACRSAAGNRAQRGDDYVAAVGDWMFGFRFFVPLLPLAALLIAVTTSLVGQYRRQWGWAAMVMVVGWCGVRAEAFERSYETTQNASWLRHPSLDTRHFFKGYDDVLAVAAEYVPPRTLIAYNQAGFVPFMLDLHNIDNLGVATKFYAELPSTDVVFTEVGRYTTLTNTRSIRATDAYLLDPDVPFLFAGYNSGLAPPELIDGYYRRIRTIQGRALRADRSQYLGLSLGSHIVPRESRARVASAADHGQRARAS